MTEEWASNGAIGDILGGMIAFDQSITNSLLDTAWESAEDWATRYRDLYRAIKRVNRDVWVQEVMQDFGPGNIQSIEHYRKMQGKPGLYEN